MTKILIWRFIDLTWDCYMFSSSKKKLDISWYHNRLTSKLEAVGTYQYFCIYEKTIYPMKSYTKQSSTPTWLVVSTHLKNMSQIGSFPQVGVKIIKCLKPPPSYLWKQASNPLLKPRWNCPFCLFVRPPKLLLTHLDHERDGQRSYWKT